MAWPSSFRMALLLLFFAAISTACLTLPIEKILKGFLLWIKRDLGPWGPLVLAVAYIPLTVLAVPASILTIGGGYLFGLPVGFFADSIGATIGATAAFILGRTLGRSYVTSKLKNYPKFQAIAVAIQRSGFKVENIRREHAELLSLFPSPVSASAARVLRRNFPSLRHGHSFYPARIGVITMETSLGGAMVDSGEIMKGDKLILRGLRFHGFHGVKPEERKLGQKFLVDVDAWMDLRAAGRSDCLSDTISYTDIYRIVKEIVEGPPQNLLESVAQLIASTTLTKHSRISAIRVKVGKPHVAVQGPVDYLGVEILRYRSVDAQI